MDSIIQDSAKIIATLGNLFKRAGLIPEFEVLANGKCNIEHTDWDNWNGGTDIFSIYCTVPLYIFSRYELEIESLEENIKQKANKLFRKYPQCLIGEVVVTPMLTNEIHEKFYKITAERLLQNLELQKSLMISVSTGGPKIETVKHEYNKRHTLINDGLVERNINNTISFKDLWEWYGKWSAGGLQSYQSRRAYITELFTPLIQGVKKTHAQSLNPIFEKLTGWTRVDRSVGEIKKRLAQASNEEQYQAIGLLCRETLISLSQVVSIEDKYLTQDGVKISKTDTKRIFDAYFTYELSGGSNENLRRYAKVSLDLANTLTHSRSAKFRLAALCAEATNAVINIVAIISGRRDPK